MKPHLRMQLVICIVTIILVGLATVDRLCEPSKLSVFREILAPASCGTLWVYCLWVALVGLSVRFDEE